LTETSCQRAETVAEALEHEAHEDPVERAEAAEVAASIRLVRRPALPVGHPPRAHHHLADVRLGAGTQALGIQCTGRDVALRATRRGVWHVLDREPVARVEEARRPTGRQ